MITITFTTPTIILIALAIALLVWITSSDSTPGYLGSGRSWAVFVSIIIMIIAIAIVGGIWWW